MKKLTLVVIWLALWVLFAPNAARSEWDEYDDSQSHPLRITGYLLHPAGVVAEWLVFRPLHVLFSTPGLDYLFGHTTHPPIFSEPQPRHDYGVQRRVPVKEKAPPKKAPAPEPVAERVTIKIQEVVVEKPVIKEVSKIVEVEKVVFSEIAFRFDSAELTDLGKGKTYLVAQKLKDQANVVVVIEGHADQIGTEEYNQRLGMRRAETVKQELADLGVDPGRMSVTSLGESRPAIDQPTDWARAVNRRVEFRVTTAQ